MAMPDSQRVYFKCFPDGRNARVNFEQKPQWKIICFKNYNYVYVINSWPDKALHGSVVNRALSCLHGGSLVFFTWFPRLFNLKNETFLKYVTRPHSVIGLPFAKLSQKSFRAKLPYSAFAKLKFCAIPQLEFCAIPQFRKNQTDGDGVCFLEFNSGKILIRNVLLLVTFT